MLLVLLLLKERKMTHFQRKKSEIKLFFTFPVGIPPGSRYISPQESHRDISETKRDYMVVLLLNISLP